MGREAPLGETRRNAELMSSAIDSRLPKIDVSTQHVFKLSDVPWPAILLKTPANGGR